MKASILSFFALFLLLAGGTFSLRAQTTNTPTTDQQPNSPATHANAAPFLTPAQKNLYSAAHAKALADNPDLKTEGENLMKKGEALMADGLEADKKAFVAMVKAYRQKLRRAMLKEEPSLKATFAEIDRHLSEMRHQHLGLMQSPPASTNAAPVQPAVKQ